MADQIEAMRALLEEVINVEALEKIRAFLAELEANNGR